MRKSLVRSSLFCVTLAALLPAVGQSEDLVAPTGAPDVEFFLVPPPPDPIERIRWNPVPTSSHFDMVRGDLGVLRDGEGDFALATEVCLANDIPMPQVDIVDQPEVGQVHWYLVLALNSAGNGTYDSLSPSQHAPRDPGIGFSGVSIGCTSETLVLP